MVIDCRDRERGDAQSQDLVVGWDKVLEVASTLVLPVEKVYDLYEHVSE